MSYIPFPGPYIPQPWEVYPYPHTSPPWKPQPLIWPNRTTVTTTGKWLDLKTKREKDFEELLRMAVDELLTGDEDAWALAEMIEDALNKENT